MITKTTDLGDIHLSLDVVASITGGAATECYGVVGMASQKIMKDGFYDLLGKDNYAKRDCRRRWGNRNYFKCLLLSLDMVSKFLRLFMKFKRK